MVHKVKRSEGLYNTHPYLVGVNYTMKMVKDLKVRLGVSTFLVTDDESISPTYNTETSAIY
jgi:hypothetical protein